MLQDLALIGGGHSHAIALRLFGRLPMPNVRLTLLTEVADTPYSGMLPGHVAGFYTRAECHIDLRALAAVAGARLVLDQAIGLDLVNRRIFCEKLPSMGFDLVSIDIGSTPRLPLGIAPGHTVIPAKPVRAFLDRWYGLVKQVMEAPDRPVALAIVGGGAGGVELAFTMQHHLAAILTKTGQPVTNLTLHLVQRGAVLMPHHPRWVGDRVRTRLTERGIQLHLQETVQTVQSGYIGCQSGLRIACDQSIWVTQAAAPTWLAEAGLAVDPDGFVLVDDTLRSPSHPQVFAAGDIATMVNHPRPKAGVFAVRQGKPLFLNLQRALQERPLKPFYPQKRYLSLLGTGDGAAIAAWGAIGWESRWLWHWKDRIDRAFMQQFSDESQLKIKH